MLYINIYIKERNMRFTPVLNCTKIYYYTLLFKVFSLYLYSDYVTVFLVNLFSVLIDKFCKSINILIFTRIKNK